jgi:hypothetical protein
LLIAPAVDPSIVALFLGTRRPALSAAEAGLIRPAAPAAVPDAGSATSGAARTDASAGRGGELLRRAPEDDARHWERHRRSSTFTRVVTYMEACRGVQVDDVAKFPA